MSCDAPASKFVCVLIFGISAAPVIVRPSVVDTVLSSALNLNEVSRFRNPCVSLSSKTIKSSSFVVVKKSVSPSKTIFSPASDPPLSVLSNSKKEPSSVSFADAFICILRF
jgi:hypothetical protein